MAENKPLLDNPPPTGPAPPYQAAPPGGGYPAGYSTPGPGYQPAPPAGYQPPQGGYQPPSSGYQPPYAPTQAPPHGYQGQTPTYAVAPTSTTVLVQNAAGNCPVCGVGIVRDEFSVCGIILAIVFFPIGLLCCLLMTERKCSRCGALA